MSKRGHGEGTIYQRPDGRWAAAITTGFENGRQQRKFVYGKTKSQVRDKLLKLREMQAAGTLPKPNRRTVGEYIDQWLATNKHNWSERTLEMYTFEAEKYVKPRIGSLTLSKVDAERIAQLQAEVADEHGKRSAQKTRQLLHRVFDNAYRHRLVPRNPAADVTPIRADAKQVEPVPISDLRKFLAEFKGTRWDALFHLFAVTGLRRGELLGLHWADVTDTAIVVRGTLKVVNNRTVVSRGGKTKRAVRRFPIGASTHAALVEHKRLQDEERSAFNWDDQDLIFPNTRGRPMNPHNLYHRVLYPTQDRLEIERFNLHQLRYTYGSMMIRQGVDPKLLADRLGHARASFTMDQYVRLFQEQRDHLAFGLEDLMGGEEPS